MCVRASRQERAGNVIPPFASSTYCRTIIGAPRACQVISHFSNLDGLPQQIVMIGSSGAMARSHLRDFNTSTPITCFDDSRGMR